jgi:hypothetical protein
MTRCCVENGNPFSGAKHPPMFNWLSLVPCSPYSVTDWTYLISLWNYDFQLSAESVLYQVNDLSSSSLHYNVT